MCFCIVCGAHTRPLYYERKQITFHCCTHCGFTYKNPDDRIPREEEFTIYERHNNSIDDPAYVNFFLRFLHAAVFPFAGPGKAGLDFGSGPSPVLATLLKRDFGYMVDVFDKFYAPNPIYQGKRYDLITCTEVIEHIPNPVDIFSFFASLMHKDSLLSVMTLLCPASDDAFLQWHYMRDMSHLSFYTPCAMRILAEKCGFEIVFADDVRYISFRLQQNENHRINKK